MNAALSAFLSAKASGTLASVPADDVYDMISAATEDLPGLARSLGLPEEAADVDPGSVARPLVESYLDSLARDDGGAFALRENAIAEDYRARRRDVSRTLGLPEAEVDAAYEALDAGHPEAFDRMFSRYYGA